MNDDLGIKSRFSADHAGDEKQTGDQIDNGCRNEQFSMSESAGYELFQPSVQIDGDEKQCQ